MLRRRLFVERKCPQVEISSEKVAQQPTPRTLSSVTLSCRLVQLFCSWYDDGAYLSRPPRPPRRSVFQVEFSKVSFKVVFVLIFFAFFCYVLVFFACLNRGHAENIRKPRPMCVIEEARKKGSEEGLVTQQRFQVHRKHLQSLVP